MRAITSCAKPRNRGTVGERGETAADADDVGHQHEAGADEQAGKDAGHEQTTDRGVGDDAIEDHHHAGRHDDAERAGGGGDGGGEVARIATRLHGRDHDGSDGAGIRGG